MGQGLKDPAWAKCRESEARPFSFLGGLKRAAGVPALVCCLRKKAEFTRPEKAVDNSLTTTPSAHAMGLFLLKGHTALPPGKPLPSLHPMSSLLFLWIQFAGSFLSSLADKSSKWTNRVFQCPTAWFCMCCSCSIDNKTQN